MSTDMTPQEMTVRQITKVVANYRAMLEKHADNFPSDAVQAVLGNPDFAADQFNLFRERVEAQSGIITRDFTVDLSLVGMDAINATGRKFYGSKDVANSMPRATVANGMLHFFQTGRYTPVGELPQEANKRGLILVDPHSLSGFVSANQDFVDTHPVGTQWLDANGNVCYASFNRWNGERFAYVNQSDDDWLDYWWFAGVGK